MLLGRTMPQLQHLGLEFAMAATFTGIVVPLLRTRPMLAAALVAAAVALLCRNLPYKLGPDAGRLRRGGCRHGAGGVAAPKEAR